MIRRALSKVKKWRKVRQNISELQSMTDRDLADIGINRYDIERLVLGDQRDR